MILNAHISILSNLRTDDDKHTKAVKFINNTVKTDPDFHHHAWESTAYLVDTYGPRLLGSNNLELALNYMKELLIQDKFENVKYETFQLQQRWVRGKEQLLMLSPRPFPSKIPMIGLGKSVGGNVTAEIIMVRNYDELDQFGKNGEITNKIVFFNANFTSYSDTVTYRSDGPSKAAKYGAIGAIIRSIASKSLENPHTGMLDYDPNYPKIPAAAISLESADMFERMILRDQKINVNLYMEANYEKGNFTTGNIMGDIVGSKYPEQIILIGGHVDTWDVGPQTGANDDTAGFMVCYEAVRLLIRFNMRPLRTIRFIAWVGEEQGDDLRGATSYIKLHEKEMKNHVLAFESDTGTTDIYGFGFSGGSKGYNLVSLISQTFFVDLKASTLNINDGLNSDDYPLYDTYKIPIMRNLVNDTDTDGKSIYFKTHHSSGDNMNILNPDDMDRNVICIASMFYILADVPWRLPRD